MQDKFTHFFTFCVHSQYMAERIMESILICGVFCTIKYDFKHSS